MDEVDCQKGRDLDRRMQNHLGRRREDFDVAQWQKDYLLFTKNEQAH